jgi:hypothetical protein
VGYNEQARIGPIVSDLPQSSRYAVRSDGMTPAGQAPPDSRLRHKLHQGRPYGQQTKCHCGGGDIRAHRVVSCLDRARMTVTAASCCEPVNNWVNYLPQRARPFPSAKAPITPGGKVSAASTGWGADACYRACGIRQLAPAGSPTGPVTGPKHIVVRCSGS